MAHQKTGFNKLFIKIFIPFLILSGLTACGSGSSNTSTNQVNLPELTISNASIAEGNSGTSELIFSVNLLSSSSDVVAVSFATSNTTAIEGEDYTAASGTLTINPGVTTAEIAVTVNGDTKVESNESFGLSLSNPVGATLANTFAVGTILNDDTAPELTVTNASITEGNAGTSNLVFPVNLSKASTEVVTVDYATSNVTAIDGEDYTAISGTLTINPGVTTAEISVFVNGDTTLEGDETFSLDLSNPVGLTLGNTAATGTIFNDDIVLNISNATNDEGNSGSFSLVFTVKLNTVLATDVTASYTTSSGTATDGVDYTASSGTITIPAGSTQTTISIPVFGDTDIEQNEYISVVLSNLSTNVSPGRLVAQGIIYDDDGWTAISLPKTGQQDCFDTGGNAIVCSGTGQDGETQTGVTTAGARFSNNGNGTITDSLTGLIWPDQGNVMPTRDPGYDTEGSSGDGAVTWQTALDYVTKLNEESYLGFNDWRMPNRNELRSLTNYGVTSNGLELAANGLNGYGRSYWSSSTWFSSNLTGASAWAVNMVSGYNFINEKNDTSVAILHVVPVRGGSSSATAPVAKTGQEQCYDSVGTLISCIGTGQDGEYQAGVALPPIRFSVNADTSITDNLTGLIWAPNGNLMPGRDAGFDTEGTDDGKVSWQTALDYIVFLNSGSGYLGFTDWRLPNINEYLSLINIQTLMTDYFTTTGWLNSYGFSNIGDIYWTSDSYIVFPNTAWLVHIGSSTFNTPYAGSSPAINKSSTNYYVWPVRGGL